MKSLPTCKVFTIGRHACISLDMKIHHILGHGIELAFYEPNSKTKISLNTSIAMQDMYNKMKTDQDHALGTKFGYIVFWSDSFQVHLVRLSSNSIWMLTFTVSPPKTSLVNKFYTYILAIGMKTWNHTPVINYYMNELQQIQSGIHCYCGRTKRSIFTKFDLLVYNSDTSERREFVGIEGGNLGMCWGVCTTIEWNNFIPCASCKRKTKERIEAYYRSTSKSIPTHNRSCSRCRDLELVGNGFMFGTKADKSYPKTSYLTQISYLQEKHPNIVVLLPFYHTFHNLEMAAKAAVINYTIKTWRKTTFCVYLQSCGLNKNCIKELEQSVTDMQKRMILLGTLH